MQPVNRNTIDNQSVTPKNTKPTGKKPAKQEMNNKPNMNRNNHIHPHPYNPHLEHQINQINQWFRQSPNRQIPTNRKSE
jgi:hypothetical protein